MTTKLLKFIPPHRTYVEVFGGGASLLFAKEPSRVEVYNDVDSGLVEFFRLLRDKEKFEEFHYRVSLIPYSREEFHFCYDTWEECDDEIERAVRWYVVARMGFSGGFGRGWGFARTESCRGMSKRCSAHLSAIEMLPEIHRRIMQVQIEQNDFRHILQTYDTPETFFYVDPPYIFLDKENDMYQHDMTEEDHKELTSALLQIQGMAMLSGYAHPVHAPLEEAGWERHDFETVSFVVGRTRGTGVIGEGSALEKAPRIETLWISPNCKSADTRPFKKLF